MTNHFFTHMLHAQCTARTESHCIPVPQETPMTVPRRTKHPRPFSHSVMRAGTDIKETLRQYETRENKGTRTKKYAAHASHNSHGMAGNVLGAGLTMSESVSGEPCPCSMTTGPEEANSKRRNADKSSCVEYIVLPWWMVERGFQIR